MKKKQLIIVVVVLILIILGIGVMKSTKTYLSQKATNECVLKYDYSVAIHTSTGYICFKFEEWCDLDKNGRKPCKE